MPSCNFIICIKSRSRTELEPRERRAKGWEVRLYAKNLEARSGIVPFPLLCVSQFSLPRQLSRSLWWLLRFMMLARLPVVVVPFPGCLLRLLCWPFGFLPFLLSRGCFSLVLCGLFRCCFSSIVDLLPPLIYVI
ncbi:hypothetical protein M5K25_013884 [Dendrobium thyrsiflorum]|uniref:Transmembrane protein n=1 Tax=Dendrobium thyrsiflorum TaxID=117978 RepID=A0ABD0UUP0_DENTH